MRGVSLAALAVTLGIGALGGLVAWALALPLGLLLGSMGVTAVIAVAGWRPFGQPVTLPARLRLSFVPIIGVAIGSAFTPEVARSALGWGPSLLALCVFVPVAHLAGFGVFRAMGIGRREALFGAVPGGLIETVALAEEAGAEVAVVTVLQFLRLILTVVSVPLIFWGLTGGAVGSAAGVSLASGSLGVRDVLVLVVAGLLGLGAARAVRLPGWIITGPLVGSALVHGLGWVTGAPPDWLVGATQVVLGTGLGARFLGVRRQVLVLAGRAALVNGFVGLLLAFGFAEGLYLGVGEDVTAVFLAFAPGGLAEMSLVALSLEVGVVFVTAHHVVRIMLAVALAQLVKRWA